MWSLWFLFRFSVIVVLILSVLWWRGIRGLWKLLDGRDWLRGRLGLILLGGFMLSKSLMQFSVDGWGCVPSLLFDLRSNDGGGKEDNGDLLQEVPCRHCCIQCPQPCSRPLPTDASAGHSWASLGQSLVESLLLSTGCWCTQESVFPQSCVSSDSAMVGLMVTSSKRAYAIPRSTSPRAPAAAPCWPVPP